MRILIIIITTFCWIGVSSADLLELYTSRDKTTSRSSLGYGFGVNIPSPYEEGAGGKVIDLSAGLKKNGSCGGFNLGAELKSIFNKEALDQYVNGLIGSIASSAPLLLACYASQTLCDLYKHYRNMANFAINLRNSQCQQVEAMAQKLGTSLRSSAIQDCIDEKTASGEMTHELAVSTCMKSDDLTINMSGTDTKVASYSLSESLATKLSDNPEIVEFVKTMLGDVSFSASYGARTTSFKSNAEESVLSDYTHKYYNALKDIGDRVVNSKTMPSDGDLKTVSIYGFPITQHVLSKLATLDATTRDNFYRSYASAAALTALSTKINSALDALETEKAASPDEARVKKMESDLKKLERKYNSILKTAELQQKHLTTMFEKLMSYEAPLIIQEQDRGERRALMPKGIYQR